MYNKTKQDKEHIQLELGHCGLVFICPCWNFFSLTCQKFNPFFNFKKKKNSYYSYYGLNSILVPQ